MAATPDMVDRSPCKRRIPEDCGLTRAISKMSAPLRSSSRVTSSPIPRVPPVRMTFLPLSAMDIGLRMMPNTSENVGVEHIRGFRHVDDRGLVARVRDLEHEISEEAHVVYIDGPMGEEV